MAKSKKQPVRRKRRWKHLWDVVILALIVICYTVYRIYKLRYGC
jgi:hypothetical protein